MSKTYTSDNIENLQFPESVRRRPGMYIGATNSDGLGVILREPADNVLDECGEGHATECDIHIDKDMWHVLDNGRGLPHGKTKIKNPADGSIIEVPTIRATVGILHTSGKFNDEAYKVSRGCFVGSTKIRLLNGKTISLEKLYSRWCQNQEPIDVMSFDTGAQKLVPSLVSHVQLTKHTRDLIKVDLPDGSVTCTPDHVFYVNRGGSIKGVQAQHLKPKDSLVSTYYSYDKDGYLSQTSQGKKKKVHRLVSEHYNGPAVVKLHHVHHEDNNVANNSRRNLKKITVADHIREHLENRIAVGLNNIQANVELRTKNSALFTSQNSEDWHKSQSKAEKIVSVASSAILRFGALNEGTYRKATWAGNCGYAKAVAFFGSLENLKTHAQARLAKLQSRVGYSHSAETTLAKLASTSKTKVSEVSENANWVKSLKTWSESLLSCKDPHSSTPVDFNAVNLSEKTITVHGRYASLYQYTSLKKLKDHVLYGEELKFHEDQSEEARNYRKNWAAARIRPLDSARRISKLMLGRLKVLSDSGKEFNCFNYDSIKSVSTPRWDIGLACVHRVYGYDCDLKSLCLDFNREVVRTTRIHLNNAVPVYDLTVEGTHKFFVEPGVLVKNSHGIGVKATNALSSKFSVYTFSSGKWRSTHFKQGTLVKEVAECSAPKHPRTGEVLKKGTLVSFQPDPEIFGSNRLSKLELFEWCKMSAYFTPSATITLSSDKSDSTRVFHYANGLLQYVSDRIATLTKQGAEFGLIGEQIFSSSSAAHECVLQFTSYDGNDLLAYTNGLVNVEGGFHAASTLNALRESLTPYLEKKQSFTLTELKEGLVGLINCKLSSAQFDSQTKEKLVDARAGEPLKLILRKEFDTFFKKNKELAKSICTRASKLRELKSKFVASKQMLTALKRISKKGLPAKAATAPKAKPEDRELYLLEGDSACFVAGTLVSTITGSIPIQDLTTEWSGPAYDVETGETKTATFSAAFSVRKVYTLLYVSLSDGTTYGCTQDHLWLTKEGYVLASDLTSDHVLLNLDHDVFVTSVTTRQLKTPVDVYDVTNLSGQQNFCLSNGSVVHNCGGMRFARDESFQEFLPLKGKPPNCLVGETEVLLPSGERVLIKDLNHPSTILAYGTEPEIGSASASFISGYVDSIQEITFEDGYVLRCTPDHLVLTSAGYVQAHLLNETHQILKVLT
jgi:DNA gyrase/topoisomerase IV subunit B/intein/homing endonuclease